MKIELSKDEIKRIRWAVSSLLEDIEYSNFNWLDVADKDLADLRNIEDKFDVLFDKADKENED